MPGRRELLQAFGLASLTVTAPRLGAADSYPSRPIKVLVAQAPAGAGDVTARALGEHLGQRRGQAIVVENKSGAGGIVATEAAAQAAADGYTLYLSSVAPIAIIPAVKPVRYDSLKDFAHITISAVLPLVLAVHPDLPVGNVAELIAYARQAPKPLTFASSGVG